jgi:hypothetical protein
MQRKEDELKEEEETPFTLAILARLGFIFSLQQLHKYKACR